jgi:tRNA (cytidine/uridine-2'-O-)-methyltransferase
LTQLRLALFQPDLAPNTGAILRTAACLGVSVDIVEPCGFPFSVQSLRRTGLDYIDKVEVRRHADWDAFLSFVKDMGMRTVLVETDGAEALPDFAFQTQDVLILGRESQGTPSFVKAAIDASVAIPMVRGVRSLNVGVAGAIAMAEALRQTEGWPHA